MNITGTFTWFGFILKFDDKLKLIKNAGFDTICTWWGNEFDLTDGNYLNHPEIADKYGLKLEHAHIPYYGSNAIWQDNLTGQALYEKYAKDITDAALSGVDTLVIHPFEKDMIDMSQPNLCIDRFKRLGDLAGNKEICLAIENLADNTVLRTVLNGVSHPYVGLCFDSGHNNIIARDDFSLLNEYHDKIFALHLHDNNATEDQHLLPYLGNLDWKHFMQTINATAYTKSFVLEASHPYEYDETEDSAELRFSPISDAEMYLEQAQTACQRALNEILVNE